MNEWVIYYLNINYNCSCTNNYKSSTKTIKCALYKLKSKLENINRKSYEEKKIKKRYGNRKIIIRTIKQKVETCYYKGNWAVWYEKNIIH